MESGSQDILLPHLVSSRDFRTNLGINNPNDHTATVSLRYFAATGKFVGKRDIAVPANGLEQLSSGSEWLQENARGGYLQIHSEDKVFAWLSHIDNVSGDPFCIAGDFRGASQWLIATTTNRGPFKSGLVVVNRDTAKVTVDFEFRDAKGALKRTRRESLQPGQLFRTENILQSMGEAANFGSLTIRSPKASRITAASVILNRKHRGGVINGLPLE